MKKILLFYSKAVMQWNKDLIDMVLLTNKRKLNFNHLKAALEQVFKIRKTHQIPLALEVPPTEWEKPYLELAQECNLSISISEAFLEVVNIHQQLTIK